MFLNPKISVLSDQSSFTGISLKHLFSVVAPSAFAKSSTILLFPVPDIPDRITNGFVFMDV